MLTLATSSLFSAGHIALTAAISGVLAAAVALLWLHDQHRLLDTFAIAILTAAAVFLLRKSANMPQLNDDGLSGLSANDWLAPAMTYIWLGVYRHLRTPHDRNRYGKALAAATIIALAVNVITI